MNSKNTIAAISTAYGRSGIGVIRVSGDNVLKIIDAFIDKHLLPRVATNALIYDKHGQAIDDIIAIYYKSPRSFTGEDMLEIQCHGNPVILDSILSIICKDLASHAKPGEFTERAFINNKIDLTQVEAVADIINATNTMSANAALRSLRGDFSIRINSLLEDLLDTRSSIEAAINFPEDESPDVTTAYTSEKIKNLLDNIASLTLSVDHGIAMNQKPVLAIIGKPNVGKSSLANLLLGEDRSIVSDEPGTTRDAIQHDLLLDKFHVTIIDTAGIRKTHNKIETAGILMTKKSADLSTLTLYLVDDTVGFDEEDETILKNNEIDNFWIISNKIDLSSDPNPSVSNNCSKTIRLSILKNSGIDLLKHELSNHLIPSDQSAGTARVRHLDHLNKATEHLYLCKKYNDNHHLDLAAEELKGVHLNMVQILGGDINEDLLDKIFSEFCIGK
jgi:tRNA modification GTPase